MSMVYRRSMVDDHISVAQLFCTVDVCFNEVFETSLANPSVRINADDISETNQCGICPGCRGEIADIYNPIVLEGAQQILFSAVTKNPQYPIKEFVAFVWEVPHFSAVLFRWNRQRQNVQKHEVQLFMFQLIAWEMLIPIFDKESSQVSFKAAVLSEDSEMYAFQIEKKLGQNS